MKILFDISREVDKVGDTTLLGRCYWRDGTDHKKAPLEIFDDATSVERVNELLNSVTGFFTIITRVESGWIVGIDCIDSIPVYYVRTGDKVLVTDSQTTAENAIAPPTFDEISVAEYRTLSYVSGSHTVYEELSQSEPGTYLHISDDGIDVDRWFEFSYRDDRQRTTDDVFNISKIVTSRLIDYADGRKIIVPLTAGFDSRLILTTLVELGYENITTISYGTPGNIDTRVSKKLADSFDVEWIYCEYSQEKWYEWYRTEDREKLDEDLWRTTVPEIREWAAIRALLEDGEISRDSVIVPGHIGMICGGKLPESLEPFKSKSPRDIEDKILKTHYKFNEYTSDEEQAFRNRIQDIIQFEGGDIYETVEAFERFEFRERQAKRITGQVWATDHLGVDWWMPMADLDFIEFWLHTRIEQRLGKNFFGESVFEIYEDVAEEPIERPSPASETPLSRVKKAVMESPLNEIAQPVYRKYVQGAEGVYGDSLSGWFGIMSLDQFKEVYNGDVNLRSYRARALLGEYDLE